MRLSLFVTLLLILALALSSSGIQAQAIASLQIFPSDAKVRYGSQLRFVAVAMSPDGSFFSPNTHWAASGGIIKPGGDTGKYTAGNIPGVYTVSGSAGGRTASAQIRIKFGAPSGPVSLRIYPSDVKMRPGSNIQFTAVAYDSSQSAHTPISINWNANGGSIDQFGGYRAGGMGGVFNVTAYGDGCSGSAQVRIKGGSGPTPPNPYPPTPTPPNPYPPTPNPYPPHSSVVRVNVTPDKVYLQTGQSAQFRARGYDAYGRYVAFTPVWTVNGGGHIDHNGYFRAKRSGTYIVTARDSRSNAADNATVFVSGSGGHHPGPGPSPGHGVIRLNISPSSARLQPGQKTRFSAVGYDRYNRVVPCNPFWTASGGTISQRGVYRASYTPGSYRITAQAGHVQATAYVKIYGGGHNPHPQPYPPQPYPPQPYPPHPQPSNARILITHFDAGGNFFRPTVRMTLQVFGYNIQSVKLYGVSPSNSFSQIDAASCVNGQILRFDSKFNRFATKYFEVRLYDNMGRIVARERRNTK